MKKIWNKIVDLYYGWIPYNWRPLEIWYKLKCYFWHRYTIVKPRYLGYLWTDRCELMPHTMFEILSEFIEQECSPGHIDWEASDHKVDVHGEEVNVREEMQSLYDWWHNWYNKEYPQQMSKLYQEAREEPFWNIKDIPEDHWSHRANALDAKAFKELQDRMIRLCRVSPYMWT